MWDIRRAFELMSGPRSQGRQTLQPLPPPDPEQWLMVVCPPCCPKLGLLSSANSARAQEMQLLMPSSQMQVLGVQVARQVQWHYRQNPDRKMSADQKTLCSSLCLQFFPATSPPHPVGERVWCQHAPLVNSIFNREPCTLRLGCTDAADRVYV